MSSSSGSSDPGTPVDGPPQPGDPGYGLPYQPSNPTPGPIIDFPPMGGIGQPPYVTDPTYNGPTGSDGPKKDPSQITTAPSNGQARPNTAGPGGPGDPGWPYYGTDPTLPVPAPTPPSTTAPAPTTPTTTPPASTTGGSSSPIALGGGWDQFATTAGTQQYWLQEAFKQGISGEAAVQFANQHGAPGIAYYADRNMYGLPNGYYVAPSDTGAMDLIQRVPDGTPGRTYGGMQGLYPYKTATSSPTDPSNPVTPTTPDPTTTNAVDPTTQGYTAARSALEKLVSSLTGTQ